MSELPAWRFDSEPIPVDEPLLTTSGQALKFGPPEDPVYIVIRPDGSLGAKKVSEVRKDWKWIGGKWRRITRRSGCCCNGTEGHENPLCPFFID